MSRDIRSFFTSKKVQKSKVEDDDIIPESPEVQIKNKKKESRKKRVLSDSDEEIFDTKKKKNSDEHSRSKSNTSQKSALKEVKAVDMFGRAPIKRTEPLVKKVKKKKNTETGIHSDDEFDQSLLELDVVEQTTIKTESTSPKKKNVSQKNDKERSEEKSIIKTVEPPIKLSDDLKLSGSKKSREQNTRDHPNLSDSNKSKEQNTSDHPNLSDSNKSKEQNSTDNTKLSDSKKSKEKNTSEAKTNKNKSKLDNANKRKFSEFVEDNVNHTKIDDVKKTKKKKLDNSVKKLQTQESTSDQELDDSNVIDNTINESLYEGGKKRKNNKTLNESVLTDEERHERKIYSATLYKKYLNRSGPKHLGSKEMPEGAPDCLKGYAILFTGVLDSFEREEITDVINKYGGCIKNSISKKVTHVLAGDEPGPAKVAKAQELGIKIINEDEFLDIIRSSKNKSVKSKTESKDAKRSNRKAEKHENKTKDDIHNKSKELLNKKSPKHKETQSDHKQLQIKEENDKETKHTSKNKTPVKIKEEIKSEATLKTNAEKEMKVEKIVNGTKSESTESADETQGLMWVDKHKPQSLKQIIGQRGENSNVQKLSNWLTKWYINRKAKLPKPSPWAKNDDGGYYKAALLSGPPGVGKTTTVSLVCKELGFDMVEFNASDTRSKNLIKEQISELLTSTSLLGYAMGNSGKQAVTKKHVLVMDEVDGMAGNEDRGGLQELIGLIKNSSVPIICMCNDRNNQKMRSLVNYCYDLRFSRPRVDQIKSALMTVCFKEGLKISQEELTQLIVSSNQDIRQSLHLLALWAAKPTHEPRDTRLTKDIKLGPWEAIRKVFSKEEHKKMSIHDRSDLFFSDYNLVPLFVQENYLQVQPHCPKNEILDRISQAAECISMGDLVEARIRGHQAWNLLPVQAMFSSVLAGQAVAGHVGGQVQFPAWLGRHSRAARHHRLAAHLAAHCRLSISGSKLAIFLDYAKHLRDAIANPLIQDRADGIAKSIEVLESYHLFREDLDSLTEITLWPGQRNPMLLVDSKVKAAMTRAYNKSAPALPYAPPTIKKGRARIDDDTDDALPDDDEDDIDDDDDPENDALVKKKKAEKVTTSNEKTKTKEKEGAGKDKAGSSKKEKPTSSKKGKKK